MPSASQRRIVVTADVDESRGNSTEILNEIQRDFFPVLHEKYSGFSVSLEGSRQSSNESIGGLLALFPSAMLASLRLALRPGAELVVVDFKRIPGESEEWIIDHVRAGQEVFTREILDAGFELLEGISIDTLEDNYVLRFKSP